MKANLTLILLFLTSLFIVGCSTPVAIDPLASQENTASYQAGYFYGPVEADALPAFKATIREMDAMGYFRTGELHGDKGITIYARKVGDDKVTVRITQLEAGLSEIRIRIGTTGSLPESQAIYARIRKAL